MVTRIGVTKEPALRKINLLLQTGTLYLGHTHTHTQKINVVHFVPGLFEKIKSVCGQDGTAAAFKLRQTLRQLVVAPKDKALDEEKAGVVYRFLCKGCDKVYICETKFGRPNQRTLRQNSFKSVRFGRIL